MLKRMIGKLNSSLVIGLLIGVLAMGVWMSGQPIPCALAAGECPVGSSSIFSNDIGIQGGTAFTATLTAVPTANRTITFPDDTGVVVLAESITQVLINKTLSSPVLTTPQINDTSADHQYVFAVSELAADRTVTMPLLTANVTFPFLEFAQTWTAAQTFNAAITIDGDLTFTGPQSLLTTTGNLTLDPAGTLILQNAQGSTVINGTVARTDGGGLTISRAEHGSASIFTLDNQSTGSSAAVRANVSFADTAGTAVTTQFLSITKNGTWTATVATQDADVDFAAVTNGSLNNMMRLDGADDEIQFYANFIDTAGSYIELLERTAPGAGPANTVRIYAVVDSGSLTDLVAVFQDGTVAKFAQELTKARDAIVAAPDGTAGTLMLRRPHPGLVRIEFNFPGFDPFIITEREFHDAAKIALVQGAVRSLPVDWVVETEAERAARVLSEDGAGKTDLAEAE